jgi:hypothetical protein
VKARLPLVVVLGSSLTFLASLYLPWVRETPSAACNLRRDPFACFGASSFDGWTAADSAALSAVALVALALAALRRPDRAARLPFVRLALLTAYLAIAGAWWLRSNAIEETGHRTFAYGAYLGVAVACVGLIAATALRREETFQRPSLSRAVGLSLVLGLLASFFLPWRGISVPHHGLLETPAIPTTPTVLAIAILWLSAQWWERESRREHLLATAAVIVLVVATIASGLGFVEVPFGVSVLYGS